MALNNPWVINGWSYLLHVFHVVYCEMSDKHDDIEQFNHVCMVYLWHSECHCL